ncbi:ACT domain-containing protein [Marilutibacter aestuarii]|uniref:ACT domain-containing protein n=1 Tax=Marilutibacter aestuarii TaxID=1706195 RepID=A0A508ATJ7_9GAMM|nr:ACT domain-containing protein [Lysobacter aestuarii]TQD51038.1 ACT domain-containing protein [Lysobacter aestuarii]
MTAETDLATLLATLRVDARPGEFVFVLASPSALAPPAWLADAEATVRESGGLSVVMPRQRADALGLPYDFVACWLTLAVHSALHAVGLTAAVSTALAREGIACNVIAGLGHDHLLVPSARRQDALDALARLVAQHRPPPR